jgi:hypothetical protein
MQLAPLIGSGLILASNLFGVLESEYKAIEEKRMLHIRGHS